MVYDPLIGAVVLFGGANMGGGTNCTRYLLADTWEYSASGWHRVLTNATPPARDYSTATYDANLGGVLLFGGEGCRGPWFNDTWLFKGGNWTNLTANITGHHSPPEVEQAAMAFDAKDGYDVLYGGWSAAGPGTTTWTFTNNSWAIQKCIVRHCNPPPFRADAAMSYDPVAGKIVLFGGVGCNFYAQCYSALNDTWWYSGGVWANATRYSGNSPGPRFDLAMTWDSKDKGLVTFGGYEKNAAYGPSSNATWVYVNHTWTNATGGRSPPPAYGMSMAYDAKLKMVILFGGLVSVPPPVYWKFVQSTWGLAGGHWSRL
jgi:hypothetical protein